MTSVLNVAQYIIKRFNGKIESKRLQKLCYYCKAWSLTWRRGALFPERIEAWAGGPIIPELFIRHRGQYWVTDAGGDWTIVEENAQLRDAIDRVLATYGNQSGDALADSTHVEDPWVNARAGLGPGERGNREITDASMISYYSRMWRAHINRVGA